MRVNSQKSTTRTGRNVRTLMKVRNFLSWHSWGDQLHGYALGHVDFRKRSIITRKEQIKLLIRSFPCSAFQLNNFDLSGSRHGLRCETTAGALLIFLLYSPKSVMDIISCRPRCRYLACRTPAQIECTLPSP